MTVALFQIVHEKDKERVSFENYENTIAWAGKIDPDIYDPVWTGEVKDPNEAGEVFADLEELYYILNAGDKPEGYRGRSMSVSDVVVAGDKAYFTDSIGFREIAPEGFVEKVPAAVDRCTV